MRQKIFTPQFAEDLELGVELNLSKYLDPDFDWAEAAKDYIRELDFDEPDLSDLENFSAPSTKNDFEVAKRLYLAYRNITPLQAKQKQFWQYLSHVQLYKYMRKRWSKVDSPDCPASYIDEHWFYGRGLIRNWLEGLYWSVKTTVVEKEGEDPDFTYTAFLFSDQNIRNRGFAAAPYVMGNIEAVKGVCRFCIEELKKKEEGKDTVFDKYFEYRFQEGVIQAINKLGGLVELASFTEDDFYQFLVENRSQIKSVGDRKKERKEQNNLASQTTSESPESVVEEQEPEATPAPQKQKTKSKTKKKKHKKRRK